MKTEKFNVAILRNGKQEIFPIEVIIQQGSISICANIYGKDVHFFPDEHNSLRPVVAGSEIDKELLYQVSRAIRGQRPA